MIYDISNRLAAVRDITYSTPYFKHHHHHCLLQTWWHMKRNANVYRTYETKCSCVLHIWNQMLMCIAHAHIKSNAHHCLLQRWSSLAFHFTCAIYKKYEWRIIKSVWLAPSKARMTRTIKSSHHQKHEWWRIFCDGASFVMASGASSLRVANHQKHQWWRIHLSLSDGASIFQVLRSCDAPYVRAPHHIFQVLSPTWPHDQCLNIRRPVPSTSASSSVSQLLASRY